MDWHVIAIGAGFSALVLLITDSQFLVHDYCRAYQIQPIILVRYVFLLILQIYKSGFTVIRRIIGGREEVFIFEYQSILKDGLSMTFLANAITLTPGTVTTDADDDKLIILSFGSVESNSLCHPDSPIRKIEKILSGKP